MSSYPPGGDYDERLLDTAPKATKAEKQEGYNVNLLASDASDSPMNARTQPTVDGHTTLETGTPPNKELYSPYSVPWYRQTKWRVYMLIGAIIIIGAIVGGAVGGTVGHNNSNKAVAPGSSSSSRSSTDIPSVAPAQSSGGGAAPQPGITTSTTQTGANVNHPTSTPTGLTGGGNSLVAAPVVH